MRKCYILSGIPCSGKSSWVKDNLKIDYHGYKCDIISCDKIREELFGKNYKYTKNNEERVWDVFYYKITLQTHSFIIDNTNCKQKYINKIKSCLIGEWDIEIKRFDIPLWKAYYRNILRYLFTGKWIPFKIIKNMKKNYDSLWKE